MHSWEMLPRDVLQSKGPMSLEFLARGIADFRASGRYLHALPYGRTANRADFRSVLHEGKGTCSTKHALLAALAGEQGIPVVLTLGLYAMSERNTPGVGMVLSGHGLECLPEAHCYVTYDGKRIDITRSGVEPAEPISQFLHEEAIVPEQIGDYKVTLHRRFMRQWVHDHTETVKGRSFEEVWRIREACISALAQ
ncbi:MAG: hypothetical protein HOP18_19110 [Deltaproteobacteria bacterium]|nr:hypothetical protein [Deltaproteobacteria bacterium]